MEQPKAKIAMYVKRNFGEKITVSFDFIKENWKPLFKFSLYLILPLCLLQALSLNGLMGGVLSISTTAESGAVNSGLGGYGIMFFVHYGLLMLCYLIGSIVLTALVYGLMKMYADREERLEGITLNELRPLLLRNIGRLLKLFLLTISVSIVAILVMGLLFAATPYTLILTLPLFIAFVVALSLMAPIYLFEKLNIRAAFMKTFRLGFATWGGIFLIMVVMGLIAGILQGITMLPWYIATIVRFVFTLSGEEAAATVSPFYSFFVYLLAILQSFGAYLSMIISLVGLAYQYGHASEVVESISVEEDIDNFDKL